MKNVGAWPAFCSFPLFNLGPQEMLTPRFLLSLTYSICLSENAVIKSFNGDSRPSEADHENEA